MFIKAIVIEGVDGEVEIRRMEHGARVSCDGEVICEMRHDEPRESRFASATKVARIVCGTDRRGRVNATNSMIHDVLNEIERVAGC